MAGIIPIPNTRVSGLLTRQRLTQQFQADQLDLFRVQEQISTGQRIVLPSDDPPAALRAVKLQQILERKGQLETNMQTGQRFLSATDSALSDVAQTLADLRGQTLGVAGTISTEEERNTAISQVNRALDSLVGIANRKFQGRYLFSGSQTSEVPYAFDDTNVVYQGNDRSIRSFSDFGVLFASNATGQQVFGGFSQAVEGSADLNPQLSLNTPLGSLRGGLGISPDGAITLSDGVNTSIVDLSKASTVGDVVRLIEENPPTGHSVEVTLTGTGINLQLDSGNIIVDEVASGTAARELGILEPGGAPQITGGDLDPVLRKTTRLDDLLGTKARAKIVSGSGSDNNDILLEANANGAALDGVTVQFVDDDLLAAAPGLTAGNEIAEYHPNAQAARASLAFTGGGNDLELTAATAGASLNGVQINIVNGGAIGDNATVTYDPGAKTMNIAVDNTGATTIQTVIDEIAAEGTFTAAHDSSIEGAYNPAATIQVADIGNVAGNTGSSGGDAKTLYVRIAPGETNASSVVDAINAEGTFTATLDPNDTTSVADAGTGLVNLSATTTTSGGSGTTLDQTSGIQVVNGGETHEISFENATTVEDLVNLLNSSEAGLKAEINSTGTGINVFSRMSGSDFHIGENGGQTATQLGLRTFTGDSKLSKFNYGTGIPTQEGFKLPTITGTDFTITAKDGQTLDVDLSGSETLADVIDNINTAATGAGIALTAQLAVPGNIVELADTTGGTGDLSVTRADGSEAARYLGLIPSAGDTGSTSTTTLTGNDLSYTDFSITDKAGQRYGIDLSGAKTVDDVLTAINSITGGNVVAQLVAEGNGIELVDTTGGTGEMAVTQNEGSQTAEYLGLVPSGETEATSGGTTLTGVDRNYLETDSVFTTLVRLRDALVANDINAVERAIEMIDADIDRVTFARADVGARQQGLQISQQNLEVEDVQLRSALSEEIDVDLVEAISELTARQIAVQASLQSTASILQLSLLDFI